MLIWRGEKTDENRAREEEHSDPFYPHQLSRLSSSPFLALLSLLPHLTEIPDCFGGIVWGERAASAFPRDCSRADVLLACLLAVRMEEKREQGMLLV